MSSGVSSWVTGNKPLRVLVSAITVAAFLLNFTAYDCAWAADGSLGLSHADPDGLRGPGASLGAGEAGAVKELRVDTFVLPEYLGYVRQAVNAAPGKPTIIHIQDAHCNYAAQHKIANIIGLLNKEYGINIVNLEGGAGDYDLSIFTRIGEMKVRQKVADQFVGEGLLNGAEYFAATNPGAVLLWGVEDPKLYLENLDVYRRSTSRRDEIDRQLKSLSFIVSSLKARIYSKKLLEFDLKYAQYKTGALDFREYITFLSGSAKERSVEIRKFANIFLLNQTLEAERAVDFKKANAERDQLLDKLQKLLSKNELNELVLKTLEMKTEVIPQRDFYSYLVKKAKSVDIDLDNFPALQSYVVYMSMYSAVDKMQVQEEIASLEDEIRTLLCQDRAQEELGRLSKNLVLLKNLFNIALTKSDFLYYQKHEEQFATRTFASFIAEHAPRYQITATLDADIASLDQYREDLLQFYDYSLKRDDAFLRNMRYAPMPVSRGQAAQVSILVTGGFHSENLWDLFKKNGIGFVSVMPNFRNEDGYECPYFKLLAGELSGLQQKMYTVLSMAPQTAVTSAGMQVASMLSRALGEEVWGRTNLDAYEAAVALTELAEEGGWRVGDITDITVTADRLSVVLSLRDGAAQKEIVAQDLLYRAHEIAIDRVLAEQKDAFAEIAGADRTAAVDRALEAISDTTLRQAVINLMRGTNGRGETIHIQTHPLLPQDEHAGGYGITVRAALRGTALQEAIIHGIIAGFVRDHQFVSAITAALLRGDDATARALFDDAPKNQTALWEMTPDERAEAERDFRQAVSRVRMSDDEVLEYFAKLGEELAAADRSRSAADFRQWLAIAKDFNNRRTALMSADLDALRPVDGSAGTQTITLENRLLNRLVESFAAVPPTNDVQRRENWEAVMQWHHDYQLAATFAMPFARRLRNIPNLLVGELTRRGLGYGFGSIADEALRYLRNRGIVAANAAVDFTQGVPDLAPELGSAEELPDAMRRLLFTKKNMSNLLTCATYLRILCDFKQLRDGKTPSLEFAIKNGIYFPVGDNLYITPVTESFRRHVLFEMDAQGVVGKRVEIKIPGEDERRETVRVSHYTVARNISDVHGDGVLCEKPIATVLLSGRVELYGEDFDFSDSNPIRVMIFDYAYDGNRITSIPPEMHVGEWWRTIATQAIEILAKMHQMGYVGGLSASPGNYRLARNADGTPYVLLAGDFEGYQNIYSPDTARTRTIPALLKDRQEEYTEIIELFTGFTADKEADRRYLEDVYARTLATPLPSGTRRDGRGMSNLDNDEYTDFIREAIKPDARGRGKFALARYERGAWDRNGVLRLDNGNTKKGRYTITDARAAVLDKALALLSDSDRRLLDGVSLLFMQGLDNAVRVRGPPDCYGSHYGLKRSQIYLDFDRFADATGADLAEHLHHELQERNAVLSRLTPDELADVGRIPPAERGYALRTKIATLAQNAHAVLSLPKKKDALAFIGKRNNAWAIFMDMAKAGLRNAAYGNTIVDYLIPQVLKVVNETLANYGGLAYQISGDEIGAVLPGEMTEAQVNEALYAVQRALVNRFQGNLQYAEFNRMSDEEKKKLLQDFAGVRAYTDMDVNKKNEDGTWALLPPKTAILCEGENDIPALEGASFKETLGVPFTPAGAVRMEGINRAKATRSPEELLNKAIADAEVNQSFAKDDREGLVQFVHIGPPAERNEVPSTLTADDKADVTRIRAELQDALGLSLDPDFPVIDRQHLFGAIQAMRRHRGRPLAVLFRGDPKPDTYYELRTDGQGAVQIARIVSDYEAAGEEKEAVQAAFIGKEEETGRQKLRRDSDARQYFGFKIPQELYEGHTHGDDWITLAILGLYGVAHETDGIIDARKFARDLEAGAERLNRHIQNESGSEPYRRYKFKVVFDAALADSNDFKDITDEKELAKMLITTVDLLAEARNTGMRYSSTGDEVASGEQKKLPEVKPYSLNKERGELPAIGEENRSARAHQTGRARDEVKEKDRMLGESYRALPPPAGATEKATAAPAAAALETLAPDVREAILGRLLGSIRERGKPVRSIISVAHGRSADDESRYQAVKVMVQDINRLLARSPFRGSQIIIADVVVGGDGKIDPGATRGNLDTAYKAARRDLPGEGLIFCFAPKDLRSHVDTLRGDDGRAYNISDGFADGAMPDIVFRFELSHYLADYLRSGGNAENAGRARDRILELFGTMVADPGSVEKLIKDFGVEYLLSDKFILQMRPVDFKKFDEYRRANFELMKSV